MMNPSRRPIDQLLEILQTLLHHCPKDSPDYYPHEFKLPRNLQREWKKSDENLRRRLNELGSGVPECLRRTAGGTISDGLREDPEIRSLYEPVEKYARIPYVIYDHCYCDAVRTTDEFLSALKYELVRSAAFLARRVFECLVTVRFVLEAGDEMWIPARILFHSALDEYKDYLERLVDYSDSPHAKKLAENLYAIAEHDCDDARRALWNECRARHLDVFQKWGLPDIPLRRQYDSRRYNDRDGFAQKKKSWKAQLRKCIKMCEKLHQMNAQFRLAQMSFVEAYHFYYRGLSEFVHRGRISEDDSFVHADIRKRESSFRIDAKPLEYLAGYGAWFFAELVLVICKFRGMQPSADMRSAFERLREIMKE